MGKVKSLLDTLLMAMNGRHDSWVGEVWFVPRAVQLRAWLTVYC